IPEAASNRSCASSAALRSAGSTGMWWNSIPWILRHELRGQNLHVAGQHHQVDAGSRQQSQLRLFSRSALRGVDRYVVEFDSMETRQSLAIRVIAHDQGNHVVQFSGLVAVEEIGQTVQIPRYEDGHPRRLRHQAQAPSHVDRKSVV